MVATVIAVASDSGHNFSKPVRESITLIEGLGVQGDVHAGVTVKHRSRVAKDPTQPNLRQVHLMHAELFDDLAADGFTVLPGQMGENVTTRGVDLLGLPTGTLLSIGASIIEITGLRNPCSQLNQIQDGLMQKLVFKAESGDVVRLSGVMGVVKAGGDISAGDVIKITLPDGEHHALECV